MPRDDDTRFGGRFEMRAPNWFLQLLERAARARMTSTSEFARQAILKELQIASCDTVWALVKDGAVVVDPATGFPETARSSEPPAAGEYLAERDGGGEWKLVSGSADSQPFDPAKHYRLKPSLVVGTSGDVIRLYPVVLKTVHDAGGA